MRPNADSPIQLADDKATQAASAPVTGLLRADFSKPEGAPAFNAPESVSWQVFKNPISLFIGGITAVLLELAEPRVRSGVWEHTTFRTAPLKRMKRTGFAAMMTVYGPRESAEVLIAKVSAMYGNVHGVTPGGVAYCASDVELLNWVHATASFGFMEAYSAFVRPLSDAVRDQFYAEGQNSARAYGALGAPMSRAELETLFAEMKPKLERSDIVFEFLHIMRNTAIFPLPFRPLQRLLVRAAINILPRDVREILGLESHYDLKRWEKRLIRTLGRLADRIYLPSSPPVQACVRMGLPRNYLYRRNS